MIADILTCAWHGLMYLLISAGFGAWLYGLVGNPDKGSSI